MKNVVILAYRFGVRYIAKKWLTGCVTKKITFLRVLEFIPSKSGSWVA
jgi:hypothetical protein